MCSAAKVVVGAPSEHEKDGEQSARRKTVGRGPRSTGALRSDDARVQGLQRQERRVEGGGRRRGRFSGQTERSVLLYNNITVLYYAYPAYA